MAGNKFDEMLKGIGVGIADVRIHLVETAWYGQQLPDAITPAEPQEALKSAAPAATAPSFDDYAKDAARTAQPRDDAQQKEQGIDR